MKTFNINKKIKFLHLSELVRCYFDLIFDQQVEVIYYGCFRNSKVLIIICIIQFQVKT